MAELKITKPIGVLNRAIKVSFKDFFTNLGKAVISGIASEWVGASKSVIDTIGSIRLKEEKPEELAWQLIFISITSATDRLVEEAVKGTHLNPVDKDKIEPLAEKLNVVLEGHKVTINHLFFDDPRSCELLKLYREPFRDWLVTFGLEEERAAATTARLSSYFILELNQEWGRRWDAYKAVAQAIETPFTKADRDERSWQRYLSFLEQQIEQPMFEESFSLNSVYIPTRASYRRAIKAKGKKPREEEQRTKPKFERHIVDLDQNLAEWALNCKKSDALRVISGGPGSGKSSFCKKFAADHAAEFSAKNIMTLMVPLHHFDPSEDSLVEGVEKFLAEPPALLSYNPLRFEKDGQSVLLIFDGLDELAQSGRVGGEVAAGFVRSLLAPLHKANVLTTRLRIILTGRELVVNTLRNFHREDRCYLEMLPYVIQASRYRNDAESRQEKLFDADERLRHDQRDDWWRHYGEASGRDYQEMPKEMKGEQLDEITAEPLLNYLVALATAGGMNVKDSTTRNEVYQELIRGVWARGWENRLVRQHRAIAEVSEEEFFRVLEEIALATWHGDGRKTTVSSIVEHCSDSGLTSLLEKVTEGAKQGVTSLLAAFYFKQAQGDETYEFTHKSFGEHLAARRILRLMRRIHQECESRQDSFDRGYDHRQALVEWAKVTGQAPIDSYRYEFLCREVRLQASAREASSWQRTFAQLWQHAVIYSTPMEELGAISFREMLRRRNNAEETLLAAHSACGLRAGQRAHLEWSTEHRECVGCWLHQVRGQRRNGDPSAVVGALTNLSLVGLELGMQDLSGGNLDCSDLSYAHLRKAIFSRASLRSVRLVGADLVEADLTKADLTKANMTDVDLRGASLPIADLTGANLAGADLERANLSDANLTGANLAGADLRGADLGGANLNGAKLSGAKHLPPRLRGP